MFEAFVLINHLLYGKQRFKKISAIQKGKFASFTFLQSELFSLMSFGVKAERYVDMFRRKIGLFLLF